MLSQEDNELLTQTGPGTPAGDYFRRYWLPAMLASELPSPDCPPVRVKLLGEDLVAFRDTQGRVGLIDEFCPHRRASLFWGRNEECGLRCVYHGWKFDLNGACVEMPNEPPEYGFENKIRTTAYPTREYGGLIWAYMGPPDQEPELPKLRVGPRGRKRTAISPSVFKRRIICKPSKAGSIPATRTSCTPPWKRFA